MPRTSSATTQRPSGAGSQQKILVGVMYMMRVKWKGKTEFLVLTRNKIYDVISVEKGWYRIIDDSGDEYLYPPEKFEIIVSVSDE